MDSDRDIDPRIIFIIIVVLVVLTGLFTPVRDKILFQVDKAKSALYYRMNPPDEAVFVPQEISSAPATAAPSNTPTSGPTSIPTIQETLASVISKEAPTTAPTKIIIPSATPIPTATRQPLPASHFIEGVKYEDQHGVWNYCAPTNLSMALTFWGWDGNRMEAGKKLKPFNKDKNVMFYEMQEFISEETNLRSIVRPGGTEEIIKRLLYGGFPILVEKGSYMQEVNGKWSWMGHYNIVTGYDDEKQQWTVQDSYYTPNYIVSYALMQEEWRAFNYQFLVVYPQEKETELFQILGSYTNEQWAIEHALGLADQAIKDYQSIEELFYAYFNRGSCLVDLQDYNGAALSYDEAFKYYAEFETDRRPYRIVWYQTGPYYAYYYAGRYFDVKNLADLTLASTSEPYLEESYYWRAMASLALGESGNAANDLADCLEIHKGFIACETLLAQMEVNP